MTPQPVISEGVFIYALGLVIIATHPGRFWLGLAIAVIPVLLAIVGRLVFHRP
jgi:hypothetical protein